MPDEDVRIQNSPLDQPRAPLSTQDAAGRGEPGFFTRTVGATVFNTFGPVVGIPFTFLTTFIDVAGVPIAVGGLFWYMLRSK